MAKYLMAAFSDAKPGGDDENNHWQETDHMPEVCRVPGVKSGRRYQIIPASPVTPDAKYLTLYELDVEDPIALLEEMGRRAVNWSSSPPSADLSKTQIMLYEKRYDNG